MAQNEPACNLSLLFTHLSGNFSHKGIYTLYLKCNRDERAFSELRPPATATPTPSWLSGTPCAFAFPVGTFALQFEVRGGPKSTFGSPPREVLGCVEVPLCELLSEAPRPFQLLPPTSPMGHKNRQSPGSVVACVSASLSGGLDLRPYRAHIDAHPALRPLRRIVSMIGDFMEPFNNASIARTVKASHVLAGTSLQFIVKHPQVVPDVTRLLEQNVIWDLCRQVEFYLSVFRHSIWESKHWSQKAKTHLAEDLFPVVSGSLAIIFGFANSYQLMSYSYMGQISNKSCDAALDFQYKLTKLGAQMYGIRDMQKALAMDNATFFQELAKAYASEFKSEKSPSGPWMEFMGAMRGRIATAMLDGYKAYIDHSSKRDASGGAHLRGTARRLMATLAHSSLMLPSTLEIPAKHIGKDEPALHHGAGAQRGGYGSVVFATMQCPRRGRTMRIAIKTIDKAIDAEAIKHTYLEILNGWTLSHRHLLKTEGIVHRKGMVAIVSERMEGGVLSKYIRGPDAFRGLSPERKIRLLNLWLRQVADGIKYMHDEGIAHGDLHAGNIFLDTSNGTNYKVVIGDFGLSIYIDAASNAFQSTRSGNARYLAPEQCLPRISDDELRRHRAMHGIPTELISGSHRPTTQTDLFSFAMLCVELYTQQKPFANLDDRVVGTAILEGMRPTPLPRAITDQQRLLKRVETCWSQNPAAREDAGKLLRDMQHVAPFDAP